MVITYPVVSKISSKITCIVSNKILICNNMLDKIKYILNNIISVKIKYTLDNKMLSKIIYSLKYNTWWVIKYSMGDNLLSNW